ncbi:MAG: avidin/streptavidin family protein [Ferruginibacter sp.]
MSFTTAWINSYHSLMKLTQDPVTGMLNGTYASTTGGTGTYDVIGWASLQDATPAAGKTMAISILWRSNDGGKSDPSHEVSGMAGQAVAMSKEENLELLHLFVETNPATTPQIGFYPDKLIFVPSTGNEHVIVTNVAAPDLPMATTADQISGTWSGKTSEGVIEIHFQLPGPGETQFNGKIIYPNGNSYPIAGFTDIFASEPAFTWQGISFSTYIDGPGGRRCIAMAGYLDLTSNKIHLMQLTAQTTDPASTWYQAQLTQLILHRNE